MIGSFALLSYLCQILLVDAACKFTNYHKITSLKHLAYKLYGRKGYYLTKYLIFTNKLMIVASFIMLVIQQIEEVILPTDYHDSLLAVLLLMAVLFPLTSPGLRARASLQTMNALKLNFMFASLFYLCTVSLTEIYEPSYPKHYTNFNVMGIPMFFGICSACFEGNNVTLQVLSEVKDQ